MKILEKLSLYKGYFEVNRLKIENKGKIYTRDWLEGKDAVAALVYNTVTHKYIFVKQFRPGPRKDVIELVAGLLDNNGLTPMETMVKEIGEEVGYEVDHLVDMCNPFYTTPGKTNEKIHLFFASVSKKISNGGGLETENEDIEVIEIEKNDIPNLGIEDGKTLLALALYNIQTRI